ncbi:hypothetical protein HDU88_001706 [Geranomyces variabilis]|nr:hypothetical protein HDU88_001706 [Geranomyces variabilis]
MKRKRSAGHAKAYDEAEDRMLGYLRMALVERDAMAVMEDEPVEQEVAEDAPSVVDAIMAELRGKIEAMHHDRNFRLCALGSMPPPPHALSATHTPDHSTAAPTATSTADAATATDAAAATATAGDRTSDSALSAVFLPSDQPTPAQQAAIDEASTRTTYRIPRAAPLPPPLPLPPPPPLPVPPPRVPHFRFLGFAVVGSVHGSGGAGGNGSGRGGCNGSGGLSGRVVAKPVS